jgi:hypothetical protein
VIATVCQYQVVASHSYANFHSIDDLRQVLLDRYMERRGVSSIKPHLRKVYQDSSWEGSTPAILHHIPVDDEIEGLYNIYTDSPREIFRLFSIRFCSFSAVQRRTHLRASMVTMLLVLASPEASYANLILTLTLKGIEGEC